MANADKIITYLMAHKNKYCDDCIENLCDIHPRQQVNQICNNMLSQKIETSHDICFNCGKTKKTRSIAQNYNMSFISVDICKNKKEQMKLNYNGLSEDEIKTSIKKYLEKNQWSVHVAWGREHGADINARRGNEQWIIEVKGHGTRNPMRVNYFLGVIGELLQRMDEKNAKYSIALPNYDQFQKLWEKLPQLAKDRTGITCLFVDANGEIIEK